ncbi:amidase [bacterium]|nr:amidase [bacterium]
MHMTSAAHLVEMIREGKVTSRALVEQSFARIEETDAEIQAWAFLDKDAALARADELDAIRQAGKPLGALHGVPVGLKDIIDTKSMPTECGTPLMAGRQPDGDAALVERLLDAGAVIIGKTVTTEFAFMYPSKTRNPHNLANSPGGSSAGSAAAVAAGHVPLAVGSQTNGSVIRPAAFCGTYGFKPTTGIISRRGLLSQSPVLDQVGVFATNIEDMGLLADVIGGYDAADPLSYPRPRPKMFEGAHSEPPIEPNFIWFEMPYFDTLDGDARAGMMEVVEALGGQVEVLDAEKSFGGLIEVHQIIMEHQIAQNLGWALDQDPDNVSPKIAASIERGRRFSDAAFAEACEIRKSTIGFFSTLFQDVDAILTPAAPGPAPLFEQGTGDPIFSTIWTLCGLPCVTLPLLSSENGLPMGVQLVGNSEEDDRLLRTATWMQKHLMNDND